MLEVSSRLLGVDSFPILGTTRRDSLRLLGSAGTQNITHLDILVVGNWLGRCSLRSFTCYRAGVTSNAIQRTKVHFSLLKLLLRLGIVVPTLGTQFVGLSNAVVRSPVNSPGRYQGPSSLAKKRTLRQSTRPHLHPWPQLPPQTLRASSDLARQPPIYRSCLEQVCPNAWFLALA